MGVEREDARSRIQLGETNETGVSQGHGQI
jgi:hypothetical protein